MSHLKTSLWIIPPATNCPVEQGVNWSADWVNLTPGKPHRAGHCNRQ
ncbi:MAG: hypothetical protein V3V18_11260 [Methylococcales bacterium]